ncbi:MAG: 1,4-alpha-glucan branching protein GlgB [Candidatus Auribacterota bacterium]|jgi:1,4-alpha-glucan branching enzyme|nr:1,4-alpha-glucan branching protein GlgB [Candidatus Auribacterota bacterium]
MEKERILNDDVIKVLRSEHHDPFSVLGAHVTEVNGSPAVVVRAFQPHAKEVLIKRGDEEIPMEKIHNSGLFEKYFEGYSQVFQYQYKIDYNGNGIAIKHDTYTFHPVLSDYDLHLFNEGNHHRIYDKLGSHPIKLNGVDGVYFAVWAPNAKRVSVVGNFNQWDGRVHAMRNRGSSGVWELFIPELRTGELYKYEIKAQNGSILLKTDPYAFYMEKRPKTASIVYEDHFVWNDHDWITHRDSISSYDKPMSVYEVHLGSWMTIPEEDNRMLTYRELAAKLIPHVKELGFTHIELLPVAEHPFDQSWGYQVTGYYAVNSRHGSPEDFKYFVNECHLNGIGVIIDWVPGHFPKDGHGLAWFDGTCLYEHSDPRQGEHRDWGTLIFNYGRAEVRCFLLANALFWLDTYHIDGLRVDAVASMLYLDYSREEGEWIPNRYGGRENLEAIDFLKYLNTVLYEYFPGILTIAEESTSFPAVSRPTYLGGLGFAYKWNMGWMNDILTYFSKESVHRKYHHDLLTFAMIYAFHENFILVLSHDEVVHGKRALLNKMPGDMWQQFANLRLLYGYMFAQPGKKLLFMGGEFGQWVEWQSDQSLDWHLLDYELHQELKHYLTTLLHLYKSEPAMYEVDFDYTGFEWIDFHDTDNSVISFIRYAKDRSKFLVFVFNFTPVPREGYRIGVPTGGYYKEVLNSDAEKFGGSDMGNKNGVHADALPWQWREFSIQIDIPPLSAMVFKVE